MRKNKTFGESRYQKCQSAEYAEHVTLKQKVRPASKPKLFVTPRECLQPTFVFVNCFTYSSILSKTEICEMQNLEVREECLL